MTIFSRKFTTHLEIGENSFPVDVLYSTEGKHILATEGTPEEFSDIHIFAVYYKDTMETVGRGVLNEFQENLLYYEASLDWDVYMYESSLPDIDRQYDESFEQF